MKIAAFDIFHYRLALNRPLVLRGQTLRHREGFLIRLTEPDGAIGWGEIAPLPGFNTESLAEALAATRALAFAVTHQLVPNDLEELSGGFDRWLGTRRLPASVQAGFETAVLNLAARTRGISLDALICSSPLSHVPVNGLISSSREQLATELARLHKAEYRAVKVKVGRGPVEDDCRLVKEVRDGLAEHVTLRLDANRAWEFHDAVRFAEGISDLAIEYIEEPLRDPERLPEFSRLTGLPLALDETLRAGEPDSVPYLDLARAAIIRPGQLGGLEKAMLFARRVRAHGLLPVISSNIESAVGVAALTALAAAITTEPVPVGLDTVSWFAEQPIAAPLSDHEALIDVRIALDRAGAVDLNRLEYVNRD